MRTFPFSIFRCSSFRNYTTSTDNTSQGVISYLNHNKGAIGSILGIAASTLTVMNYLVLKGLEQINVKIDEKFAVVNEKFANMDKKMDSLIDYIVRIEERLAILETKKIRSC